MRALGQEADVLARVYFTGGATAVLFGWRETTIDVDIRVLPESDRVYRAIPALKESLEINVEFASPADFIPELPGWEERCMFVCQENRLSFYHYDLYAQALAKIERGHAQDMGDVQEMILRLLVNPSVALRLFDAIEPHLYLYPAIDPPTFRRSVERVFRPD